MQFNPRVTSFAAYPMTALNARKRALREAGVKIFDFGTGDPTEPTPGFIREAVGLSVPTVSQYPTTRGLPELRAAIAAYVERRFAVALDRDNEILPSTGSKEAIYNLAFLMVNPEAGKDVVIASHPGYFVPERSAAVAGAHFVPYYLNAENGFLMDLGVLDREILQRAAIAWINYPNNPTGVECSLEYLKRQVEICREYDILLCSDECYVDLFFGSTPPPSILQLTRQGVLAFHSCSKRSGMTAYRSGFIAGDASVLNAYAALRDTVGCAAPVYTQHAAIAAWSDDAHVRERCAVFREKRDILIEFFGRKGLEWVKSEAGLYFWIKAPGGTSGKEYAQKLLERGIIVSPGEFFAPNSAEYFRVAIVPSPAECAEAVKIWNAI